MKFIYIQLVVVLCLGIGGCQRGGWKGKYTLTVMMETNPQNKLFVFYKDGSDSIRVDSAIYMNGKFELKGRIPYPQRALVRMDQKNQLSLRMQFGSWMMLCLYFLKREIYKCWLKRR